MSEEKPPPVDEHGRRYLSETWTAELEPDQLVYQSLDNQEVPMIALHSETLREVSIEDQIATYTDGKSEDMEMLFDFTDWPDLGPWTHFKGRQYEVLGSATEAGGGYPLVVYKALYGEQQVWVRPVHMWVDEIDRPEIPYTGPRFFQGTP